MGKAVKHQKATKPLVKLGAKSDLLSRIINEIPEKVFLKDSEGRFLLVNQATADAYQCSPEELLNTTDFDFFKAKDAREYRKHEIEIMESGEPKYFPEEVFKDPNGNERVLQTVKKPFYIPELDETGILGIQFDITEIKTLEKEIKDKGREITGQQEAIQHAQDDTRLLGEIGQEILSSLSLDQVLFTIYEKVNKLMDATVFGIGIYLPEHNCLEYPLAIAKGKKYKPYRRDISNKNQLAVWCLENSKPVMVNNVFEEYGKYIDEYKDKKHKLESGFNLEEELSMIYLPLITKEKTMGVITVQSYEENVYTDHHLNVLRNIAVYAAIALENATLYEHLEDTVRQRTEEVVLQKESVEQAHKNLEVVSRIGQDIIASLSVEEIIEKVYKNVNTILDAAVFGIGIFQQDKNELLFSGLIEKGEKLPDRSLSLDNKDKLGIHCFAEKQEIVINDLQKEYKKYIQTDEYLPNDGSLPESIIYIPLLAKNKTIGVITVQSFKKHAYTGQHVEVLRNLAVNVAIALDNARLYQEMEDRVARRTEKILKQKEEIEKTYKNTKLLSLIGKDITSARSVDKIVGKVYEQVNTLMDASFFTIGLYNKKKNRIDYVGEMEKGKKMPLNSVSLDDDNRFGVWCLKTGKEVFINDHRKEYKKYTKKLLPPKMGDFPESIIYLPLFSKNKVIGVLSVQSFEKNAYIPYHLDILRNLGIQVSIAIDNALVYEDLEDQVKKRTKEVVRQKEKIEKAHQNLEVIGEIGQEIISSLSVEEILEKVYNNINALMDAATFGIGIFNEEEDLLEFDGVIENGEKLPLFKQKLDDEDRIGVHCFNHQKEIIINDFVKEHSKYISPKDLKPSAGGFCNSVIYLPLVAKNRRIGVITVQSFKKKAYSSLHVNIVRNLAIYTAIALDNARLYHNMELRVKKRTEKIFKQKEEIEVTYHNTKLLSQIGKDITASQSVDKIVETVYEKVNTLMDASFFTIGLYNEEKNTLDYVGEMEKGKKMPKNSISLDEPNRFGVWCLKNRKEVFINDHRKEYKRYAKKLLPPKSGDFPESIIYLPLLSKNNVLGVLSVQSFKKKAYTQYHLDILRNLAVHVAIAIENALLYEGLEETVRQRTEEVVKQKEEIVEANKNLKVTGEIGQDIIGSLSVEHIIDRVYENINALMDAATFGIGIFNEMDHCLEFNGIIENGEKLPDYIQDLTEENRLAVHCFNNRKEIFINDFVNEINNFLDVPNYVPPAGGFCQSVIYIPLISKEKAIGVLTVQSFEINAYTDNHFNIVKNLSVYAAIALDNASVYENLNNAHKIVDKTNKHITNSIRYAKRIQEAILPKELDIKKDFPNSFVLFRPKEIVSGDFYWYASKNGKALIAAIDCTGHGVPGALMSMIGNSFFNEMVNKRQILQPSTILNEVKERIIISLKQEGKIRERKDGMDAALCVWDKEERVLEYAGANNPLYLIRKNSKPLKTVKGVKIPVKLDSGTHSIYEIKPDKQPLGYAYKSNHNFKNHSLKIEAGDNVYIFTDGYPDQIGGERMKKFMYNRFREVLLGFQHESMEKQKEMLEKKILEWMNSQKQIDDICVIGLQL